MIDNIASMNALARARAWAPIRVAPPSATSSIDGLQESAFRRLYRQVMYCFRPEGAAVAAFDGFDTSAESASS